MFNFIKKLFGAGTDFQALMQEGAVVVDVRTPAEFSNGSVPGSKNIPLSSLGSAGKKLPKDKPIILCCASGMRSGSAVGILRAKGFEQVYNGGGWFSLARKIQS